MFHKHRTPFSKSLYQTSVTKWLPSSVYTSVTKWPPGQSTPYMDTWSPTLDQVLHRLTHSWRVLSDGSPDHHAQQVCHVGADHADPLCLYPAAKQWYWKSQQLFKSSKSPAYLKHRNLQEVLLGQDPGLETQNRQCGCHAWPGNKEVILVQEYCLQQDW